MIQHCKSSLICLFLAGFLPMVGCKSPSSSGQPLQTSADRRKPPKEVREGTAPSVGVTAEPTKATSAAKIASAPKARASERPVTPEPPPTGTAKPHPAKQVPEGTFEPALLLPYFADKRFAPFAKAMAKLDCAKAEKEAKRQPMNASTQAALLVRLGVCYSGKGEHATSRAFFRKAEPLIPLLKDYLFYWQGQALEKEGKSTEAVVIYRKISKDSRFFRSSQILAARALIAAKQSKKAWMLLKESGLLETYPSAWWLAGQIHMEGKTDADKQQAVSFFRRLLVRAPASDEALLVEKLERKKKIKVPLSDSDLVKRAENMNSVYDYKKSSRTLTRVKAPARLPGALRCKYAYHGGFAWFRRRKYSRAIPLLTQARTVCKGRSYEHVRSIYRLAQAYRRKAKVSRAIPYYRETARLYPKHYFADDAVFSIAELLERTKRPGPAKVVYASLLKRFPKGDMVAVAQWRIAYQAFRKGQWAEALRQFRVLYTRFARNKHYAPAALYFSGRTWQKRGNKGKATQFYKKVTAKYPMHYYSFVALRRLQALHRGQAKFQRVGQPVRPSGSLAINWGPLLKKPMTMKEVTASFAGDKADFLSTKTYQKGTELLRMGLPELAAAEWELLKNCKYFPSVRRRLLRKKRRFLRCGLRGDPGAELLALHYNHAGVYHLSDRVYRRRGRLAGSLLFSPKTARSWYLAYPRPYYKYVAKFSKRDRVRYTLAYGLMREESTFNPKIRSWANAFGLMQMLLSTARDTARTRPNPLPGHGRVQVDDLYKPEINVNLGIRHLRMLLDQFQNKYPMIIGGYNAGKGWVRRWLRRTPQAPLDEWIEAISIRQTRKYVKRVLQSYAIYQFLYGSDGNTVGSVAPIRPEWVPGTLLR